MTVRAKFRCVENTKGTETSRISFMPVTSGSEENALFFKWTPGGSCCLDVVSHAVAERFVVGEEYYVDFTAVPVSPAAAAG